MPQARLAAYKDAMIICLVSIFMLFWVGVVARIGRSGSNGKLIGPLPQCGSHPRVRTRPQAVRTGPALFKVVNAHTIEISSPTKVQPARQSANSGPKDGYGCERLRILEIDSNERRVTAPRKTLLSASMF